MDDDIFQRKLQRVRLEIVAVRVLLNDGQLEEATQRSRDTLAVLKDIAIERPDYATLVSRLIEQLESMIGGATQ